MQLSNSSPMSALFLNLNRYLYVLVIYNLILCNQFDLKVSEVHRTQENIAQGNYALNTYL